MDSFLHSVVGVEEVGTCSRGLIRSVTLCHSYCHSLLMIPVAKRRVVFITLVFPFCWSLFMPVILFVDVIAVVVENARRL